MQFVAACGAKVSKDTVSSSRRRPRESLLVVRLVMRSHPVIVDDPLWSGFPDGPVHNSPFHVVIGVTNNRGGAF